MRGGRKYRPYQKMVGAARVRGLGLAQVVPRRADPPEGSKAARVLAGEAPVPQLDARRAHGERHIEAVVDKEAPRRVGGEAAGQLEVLQAGERAPARVEGEVLAPPGRQLLRHRAQVRPAGDPLVGDGVQPRQGRERLHPKRWPAWAPRPRTQSAAGMRDFPAGRTSATFTAPRPGVIPNPSSRVRTSPGAPLSSTTRAPHSLTSPPSSSGPAPGEGSRARISRATRAAGSVHRMCVVSRVSLGA